MRHILAERERSNLQKNELSGFNRGVCGGVHIENAVSRRSEIPQLYLLIFSPYVPATEMTRYTMMAAIYRKVGITMHQKS
jgi:hypothetical protein